MLYANSSDLQNNDFDHPPVEVEPGWPLLLLCASRQQGSFWHPGLHLQFRSLMSKPPLFAACLQRVVLLKFLSLDTRVHVFLHHDGHLLPTQEIQKCVSEHVLTKSTKIIILSMLLNSHQLTLSVSLDSLELFCSCLRS